MSALLAGAESWAQETPPVVPAVPPAPEPETTPAPSSVAAPVSSAIQNTGGPVDYKGVDASTVRVFAVGTVRVDRIPIERLRTKLAFAKTSAGHGTGFVVGSDGLILTAHHVVEGASHVAVRFPGEMGFAAARVVVTSKTSDIAVLKVDRQVPAIPLQQEKTPLSVRQTVFALGYPIDPTRTQPQSARGIISGSYEKDAVQLDMAINPGNSGGPLVDEQDRVVGMVVARGNVEAGVQGIGWAVPLWKLHRSIEVARERLSKGRVRPITDAEEASAEVVDELLVHGVFRASQDSADLDEEVEKGILDLQIEKLGDNTDDPDLLVFMAGSLWNLHMVLRYAEIDELDGKKVSEERIRRLSERLGLQARDLVKRAVKKDEKVSRRSDFAHFILKNKSSSVEPQQWNSLPTAPAEVSYYEPSQYVEEVEYGLTTEEKTTVFGASLLLASDSEELPPSGGFSFNVARTWSFFRDTSAATRLRLGSTLAYGSGSKLVSSDAIVGQRDSVETALTLYSLDLGISREWQTSPLLHLIFEVDWSLGALTRQVETRTILGDDLIDSEASTALSATSGRFALGLGGSKLQGWVDLRIMSADDILYSWLGVGASYSL